MKDEETSDERARKILAQLKAVEESIDVHARRGSDHSHLDAQREQLRNLLARAGDGDDAMIERAAEAAHEVNRAYCTALGDHSQPSWEDAPDWQKGSARAGVRAVIEGGAEHTPEKSHEGWMRQKKADGWKWGPVKDPARKRHPCILPYNQLPEAQRAKDHIFIAVVRQMLREPAESRLCMGCGYPMADCLDALECRRLNR